MKRIVVAGFFLLVSCGAESPDAQNYELSSNGSSPELIAAVRAVGAKSVDGALDDTACKLASDYAATLAKKGVLDNHAGFSARAKALGGNAGEIIAMAPNAKSCAVGWYNSAGHKKLMMAKWKRYCYAMVPGTKNRQFCVGLFAN